MCAVGGWDGKIHLYSTRSFKPLGTLRYHKVACQAAEFARSQYRSDVDNVGEEVDEDEEDEKEKVKRARWLVSGGKDCRAAIWELVDFGTRAKNRGDKPDEHH